MGCESFGQLAKGALTPSRECEQVERPVLVIVTVAALREGGWADWRCLLEHDVSVDAAEAERADASPAGVAPGGPGPQSRGDCKGELVPRNVRRGLMEVQVWRYRLVSQAEDDLDQAGDPRARLGVTDVRLHRSDDELSVSAPGEDISQGAQLDRVAQWCASAMRFDIIDIRWVEVRDGESAGG